MGLLKALFGNYSEKEIKRIKPMQEKVLALDEEYQKLTDDELRHKTDEFKEVQQDLNPNYPDTRFVFGYAHDKEIYSLEVEGQKPDGVIEINVYDRTMYLWYYDDLKSDKRGNNLSYSVDVPE